MPVAWSDVQAAVPCKKSNPQFNWADAVCLGGALSLDPFFFFFFFFFCCWVAICRDIQQMNQKSHALGAGVCVFLHPAGVAEALEVLRELQGEHFPVGKGVVLRIDKLGNSNVLAYPVHHCQPIFGRQRRRGRKVEF